MKTKTSIQQESETLARYLSSEMPPEEMIAYEAKISESEESRIMIEKMKKQWTAMENLNDSKTPDAGAAWSKLHSRLRDEKLIPVQQISLKKRMLTNIMRVAALVLVLISAGIVIYLNVNRKPVPAMVRINTHNEANTLIKTLADGSIIYLAQNSQFSFPEKFQNSSRNVELKGEAFFDISPDKQKPFIIETDEVQVQVLGTAFNVKTRNGNGFELSVDRGKVKVSLKRNPSESRMVEAGEKISVVENNLVKSTYIANKETLWYRQRMHFKDETLSDIVTVLNRNFNTNFVIADKETGKKRMTATFHNETAETMTELLCVTLNLKSQTLNGSVVLSGTKEGTKQN